jgi:predicted nucleic acid-binding protein
VSTPVVIDASAGVELVARTERGNRLRQLIPADAVPWVPDGLVDIEVGSVLRRWDLKGVLEADQMAGALLRLRHGRYAGRRFGRFTTRHGRFVKT